MRVLGSDKLWSTAVVLLAGLTAACGSETASAETDANAASVSRAPLDVDVVVRDQRVSVYVREQERACTCTDEWPGAGACTYAADSITCSCAPGPGTCLTSIYVERGGALLAAADIKQIPWGVVELELAEIYGSSAAELVLEGCGGSARIALPQTPLPAHRITSIESSEQSLRVHWDSASGATHSVGLADDSHNRPYCHRQSSGMTVIDSWVSRHRRVLLEVMTLEPSELSTELGVVRLWNAATTTHQDVLFPERLQDGRWSLVDSRRREDSSPQLQLTIDGVTSAREIHPEYGSVELVAGEPRIELSGPTQVLGTSSETDGFGYRAGAAMDTLWIDRSKRYSAAFVHIAPLAPVGLGSPLGARFALELGPLVLTAEDGSGDTISVSASIQWELGLVSKPVAD